MLSSQHRPVENGEAVPATAHKAARQSLKSFFMPSPYSQSNGKAYRQYGGYRRYFILGKLKQRPHQSLNAKCSYGRQKKIIDCGHKVN
jgi:hypothetical protein